jgi:glycosyltransferase involved in cell wall biosynthesis
MNIIIIGPAYPLRGGIAHASAILQSYLAKHHTVESVTFKRQYPKLLFPGKSQEEKGPASGLIDVKPAMTLIDSINPLNWVTSARVIADKKPDLLIFRYWMPFFGPCFGTIAKRVKKATGCKVLFLCDNIIPHESRPGDIAFTKYAFRQGDCFIVQSDSVRLDLLRLFPDARFRMVPLPVYEIFGRSLDKEAARKSLNITAKRVILFFGIIRKYKGLMNLLDAMSKYRDQAVRSNDTSIAETLLMVVGEFYEDGEKYHTKIKELHLESLVRFVSDYVPNEEVNKYFSAADLAVLPYLSATQSAVIQIAYNFNKPVITTDVGGLSEVVLNNKTGYIVQPEDSDGIVTALQRFYAEGRESEFSANVAIEKKKYSWEAQVQAIEELVRQA